MKKGDGANILGNAEKNNNTKKGDGRIIPVCNEKGDGRIYDENGESGDGRN
jgi:hypothetical protein